VQPQARSNDTVISEAIMKDLKEAKAQVNTGGFAWGIRQALFGSNPSNKKEVSQQEHEKGTGATVTTAAKAAGEKPMDTGTADK
jgi:hypothetical protein